MRLFGWLWSRSSSLISACCIYARNLIWRVQHSIRRRGVKMEKDPIITNCSHHFSNVELFTDGVCACVQLLLRSRCVCWLKGSFRIMSMNRFYTPLKRVNFHVQNRKKRAESDAKKQLQSFSTHLVSFCCLPSSCFEWIRKKNWTTIL